MPLPVPIQQVPHPPEFLTNTCRKARAKPRRCQPQGGLLGGLLVPTHLPITETTARAWVGPKYSTPETRIAGLPLLLLIVARRSLNPGSGRYSTLWCLNPGWGRIPGSLAMGQYCPGVAPKSSVWGSRQAKSSLQTQLKLICRPERHFGLFGQLWAVSQRFQGVGRCSTGRVLLRSYFRLFRGYSELKPFRRVGRWRSLLVPTLLLYQ